MGEGLVLLALVLIVALVFDFINGFHDAANAIATVVSTGVLPIRTAVLMAGVLNFGGAIVGTAVAKTIANDFASPDAATQSVVLAALLGACAWNLITWWYGIPSSSTHAVVGGLLGAVVTHAGYKSFNWLNLGKKVLLPLVFSPLFGFTLAFLVMLAMLWLIKLTKPRPPTVHRASRVMQLVSAAGMSVAHGSNDAQKSMGIMTLALMSFMTAGQGHTLPEWMRPGRGDQTFIGSHLAAAIRAAGQVPVLEKADQVPTWVIFSCAAAIAFGTMAGGKKIIKTMGTKIIKITPLQGFGAEASGASTILFGSHYGLPLSTTHCINACIMGVGAVKRLSAVRWGVAGNILIAWVLTIPAAALMAALSMLVLDQIF